MPKAKSLKQNRKISAAAWRSIRLFAMDVDGILTDGGLHISSNGSESKTFNVLDGAGLVRLGKAGVITAWISGRKSGATTLRANELKIPHVFQGNSDKLAVLRTLAASLKIKADQIAYMGDDDIDVAAIEWARIGITVPTGMPVALAAANYVTKRAAGAGAVREVADLILATQKQTRAA